MKIIQIIRDSRWREASHDTLDARAKRDKLRWSDMRAHRRFLNKVMEHATNWFQLVCFFAIAYHAIMMMKVDTDKATNWALIALIIKPWGEKIRA